MLRFYHIFCPIERTFENFFRAVFHPKKKKSPGLLPNPGFFLSRQSLPEPYHQPLAGVSALRSLLSVSVFSENFDSSRAFLSIVLSNEITLYISRKMRRASSNALRAGHGKHGVCLQIGHMLSASVLASLDRISEYRLPPWRMIRPTLSAVHAHTHIADAAYERAIAGVLY